MPAVVATQRGNRSVCASSAEPAHTSAAVAPKSAPPAAHASSEPGRRRPASWPAMAPAVAEENIAPRTRWLAGRSSARRRSTGDNITCTTSAASRAMGPPWAPPRRPESSAKHTTRPSTVGA